VQERAIGHKTGPEGGDTIPEQGARPGKQGGKNLLL